MQPRTGPWSPDDQDTSNEATPPDSGWDDVSAATQPYNPLHLQAALSHARVPTATFGAPEAPDPELDFDPGDAQPRRTADPATKAALESIRPLVAPPRATTRRPPPPAPPSRPPSPAPSRVPSREIAVGLDRPRITTQTLMGFVPATPFSGSSDEVDAALAPLDEFDAAATPVPAEAAHPRSLAPVERAAPPAATARGQGSRLGWAAASVLLVLGGAFYGLAYLPLQQELTETQQTHALRLQQNEATMAGLRADFERKQHELEQLLAAAAPASAPAAPSDVDQAPARPAQASAPSERPARETTRAAKPSTPPRPSQATRSNAHAEAKPAATQNPPAERSNEHVDAKASKGGVDRSAAAAATAALEAQAYSAEARPARGASAPESASAAAPAATTPAATKSAAPSAAKTPAAPTAPTTGKRDTSVDVANDSSDDPLEGL